MALGDALAIALLERRGFTAEDFAQLHPGGSLGKKLQRVESLMRTGAAVPRVGPATLASDAICEMSSKGLGMTAVVDDKRRLLGIFTDGDLRRALDRDVDLRGTTIDSIMTRNPKTVREDVMATDALTLMKEHRISALVVVDAQQRVVGALNMHDLLRAGLN